MSDILIGSFLYSFNTFDGRVCTIIFFKLECIHIRTAAIMHVGFFVYMFVRMYLIHKTA